MRWAADLTRPAVVAATAVLILNDHVLKGAGLVPAAVTGKLSDVAGLFVAAVLAATVARALAGARRQSGVTASAIATVGLAFTALKTWPDFNAAVGRLWGHNVLDATDLYALPMLLVAWVWLGDRQQPAEVPGRAPTAAALLIVLLACAATPAAPPPPARPVAGWSVTDDTRDVRCGKASAWVSKSGKTGFAISLRVDDAGPNGCAVAIAAARVRFPSGEVIEGKPIELPAPHGPYVIFEFDNNARWNRGERASTIELDLRVDGVPEQWTLPATHVYHQYPPGYR